MADANPDGEMPTDWTVVKLDEEKKEEVVLPEVDDVVIAAAGTSPFKYVLIKVTKGDSSKFVVRGAPETYHKYVYHKYRPSIEAAGVTTDCVGGGRIAHTDKAVKVYGMSYGYGKADHSVSCAVVKRSMPDKEVSWSDEGY